MRLKYFFLFLLALPFLTAIIICLGCFYILFMIADAFFSIFRKPPPQAQPQVPGIAGMALKLFANVGSNSNERKRAQ
jgi:hypothetical protein